MVYFNRIALILNEQNNLNMKKHLLTAFAVIGIAAGANAQVFPNGAMENWQTLNIDQPNNWTTSNNEWKLVNGQFTATKSSDSRSGFAIKLETRVSIDGDTAFAYFANTEGDPTAGEGGQPFSQMPQTMTGYYKSNIAPGDSAIMLVLFKKNGAVISESVFKFTGTHSTYTAFSFPIQNLSVSPDSVIIAAASSNVLDEVGVTPGSWIMFDDLALAGSGITQTINNGNFDSWTTTTFYDLNDWNLMGELMSRTSGYKGNYGVELETFDYEDGYIGQTMLSNFKYDNNSGDPMGGLPYTRALDTLVFWYKYNAAAADDSAAVYVTISGSGSPVGGGLKLLGAASSYTKVEVPLQSFNTPDTLRVMFSSSHNQGGPLTVAGSKLTIDEVQLASTPLNTGLKNIFKNSANIGLYPNPANTVAVIQTNNAGVISYALNDITGKVILTGEGNEINLSSLNNGIYFVTIKSGAEVIGIKKLIKE